MSQFFSAFFGSITKQEFQDLPPPAADNCQLQVINKKIDDFCTEEFWYQDSDLSESENESEDDSIEEFQDSLYSPLLNLTLKT